MWKGVTKRFETFDESVWLTDVQATDGTTKHHGVRKCLNQHYYGVESETANSFLIGSWAKGTRIRPPRDVDVYFVIPVSVYHRLDNVQGNKQSILLQEVKQILEETYTSTKMRGDGQVVVVDFATFSIEVAPVFLLDSGQYYFCNTHNGGSYQVADPEAEKTTLQSIHSANNNNAKTMVRMLKAWQAHCNVALTSFQIELLVSEFIQQSPWRLNGYFYYDWLLRDIFAFMWGRADGILYAPGTQKLLHLGDAWKSRCATAYNNAVEACALERDDYVALAGVEWEKIFGPQISISL